MITCRIYRTRARKNTNVGNETKSRVGEQVANTGSTANVAVLSGH